MKTIILSVSENFLWALKKFVMKNKVSTNYVFKTALENFRNNIDDFVLDKKYTRYTDVDNIRCRKVNFYVDDDLDKMVADIAKKFQGKNYRKSIIYYVVISQYIGYELP